MIPLLVGAGIGLAKGYMDQKEANRERQRQAEIQKWSPWTGLSGQSVKSPSLLGSTMQGAMTGGMLQAANAASGTPGVTTEPTGAMALDGSSGAIGPLSGSSAYQATPAGMAMQNGTFDQYYQQNYTSPWMGVK